MTDIELLPCGVEHELRADAAIIRSWIDVANGPINREALADRLDRYANAAAELTAEIERLRAEAEQHLRQAMSNGAKARAAQAQANNLRTEVEALRKEVERWKRINAEQVKLHVKAEIRAERLAEALETCLEMEERPKVIELAKAALASLSKEEGK